MRYELVSSYEHKVFMEKQDVFRGTTLSSCLWGQNKIKANGKWVFLILTRLVPSNHHLNPSSVSIQLPENLVSIRG